MVSLVQRGAQSYSAFAALVAERLADAVMAV